MVYFRNIKQRSLSGFVNTRTLSTFELIRFAIPLIEYFPKLLILTKLLQKHVHFQCFKLRQSQISFFIYFRIIEIQKFLGKWFKFCIYPFMFCLQKELQIQIKRKIDRSCLFLCHNHYALSVTSHDSLKRSVIFTLMVPASSGMV